MFFADIPEAEKERFVAHLDGMIEKTIERGRERFKKEMESAADDLMGYVTLWQESVRENTTEFDFMNAAREAVFDQMLASDPERWSKYDIAKLLDAWQKRHPEQLKASLDAILLAKLEQAEKELAFQRRLNER